MEERTHTLGKVSKCCHALIKTSWAYSSTSLSSFKDLIITALTYGIIGVKSISICLCPVIVCISISSFQRRPKAAGAKTRDRQPESSLTGTTKHDKDQPLDAASCRSRKIKKAAKPKDFCPSKKSSGQDSPRQTKPTLLTWLGQMLVSLECINTQNLGADNYRLTCIT